MARLSVAMVKHVEHVDFRAQVGVRTIIKGCLQGLLKNDNLGVLKPMGSLSILCQLSVALLALIALFW